MLKPILRCAAVGALTLAAQAADYSFYVLGLAYTPESCAHGWTKAARACGPGAPAFVVAGLTAHTDKGEALGNCPPGRPLPADAIRGMLTYIPTEPLLQQVWMKQGACTGLSPANYFGAVRRLRDSVSIPQRFQSVPRQIAVVPAQVEEEFNRANPGLPRDGIRTACYSDGGLQEVRFCFDKNFVAKSCGGIATCTRGAVRLLPTIPKR